MYGWKARIGIILTAPNSVCEPELNRMAPEGVSIHATRMIPSPGAGSVTELYRLAKARGTKVDPDQLAKANESLPKVAGVLGHIKPDIVVLAHTLGSMIKGPEYDDELISTIEKEAGCSGLTTARATVMALKAMNIQKVCVAAPYPAELTHLDKLFLEQALPGLEVVNELALDMETALDIGNLEPSSAYQAAKDVDRKDAQAIFLSGTNWRTMGAIESIEHDLGKPVIAANQVTLWAALRMLGIKGESGPGTLFSQP